MAKKKLFGNHVDPSCEICALGMVSSDGETVLCRYAGAPAKHHFCKRFRYDPLKRTPKRMPPPDSFTAADFSLLDPAADLMDPALNKAVEEDPDRDAMRDTLRTYLDSTDSPSADDILELLAVSVPGPTDETDSDELSDADIPDENEEEADGDEDILAEDLKDGDSPDETEETDEDDEDVSEGDTDANDDEPDRAWSHFAPLASEDDIRRDMENLSIERHKGASTKAAFAHFSIELHDTDEDEDDDGEEDAAGESVGGNPTLLFSTDSLDFEEDEAMLSDDLLFMNLDNLDGETIDSLRLNADGTLSSTTEDL